MAGHSAEGGGVQLGHAGVRPVADQQLIQAPEGGIHTDLQHKNFTPFDRILFTYFFTINYHKNVQMFKSLLMVSCY